MTTLAVTPGASLVVAIPVANLEVGKSQRITDGFHAKQLVHADKAFITGLLYMLIRNHEASKRRVPEGGLWRKSRLLGSGLYWQIDSWEGQETSIGGTGVRPPMNSFRYGDAMAVSRIAALAGKKDLADHHRDEAMRLREEFRTRLWDPETKFFKVMRHAHRTHEPVCQFGRRSL